MVAKQAAAAAYFSVEGQLRIFSGSLLEGSILVTSLSTSIPTPAKYPLTPAIAVVIAVPFSTYNLTPPKEGENISPLTK